MEEAAQAALQRDLPPAKDVQEDPRAKVPEAEVRRCCALESMATMCLGARGGVCASEGCTILGKGMAACSACRAGQVSFLLWQSKGQFSHLPYSTD